jgi:hypothetical protein
MDRSLYIRLRFQKGWISSARQQDFHYGQRIRHRHLSWFHFHQRQVTRRCYRYARTNSSTTTVRHGSGVSGKIQHSRVGIPYNRTRFEELVRTPIQSSDARLGRARYHVCTWSCLRGWRQSRRNESLPLEPMICRTWTATFEGTVQL